MDSTLLATVFYLHRSRTPLPPPTHGASAQIAALVASCAALALADGEEHNCVLNVGNDRSLSDTKSCFACAFECLTLDVCPMPTQ